MPSSFSLLATVPDTHANAFQGCPETVESGNVFSSVTLFRKHPSALSQLLSSNGHHGTQEAMPLILLPHAAVVAVSQLSVAQLWSHTVCVAPQAAAWQFWLSRRPGTNGNFLGSSQVRNIDLCLGPCDADQRDTISVLPLLYHEAMTKPVLGPPYPHLIPILSPTITASTPAFVGEDSGTSQPRLPPNVCSRFLPGRSRQRQPLLGGFPGPAESVWRVIEG